jgi:hypothetical protein
MISDSASAFVYVLRIRPGGKHSQMMWEIAFNRPPTGDEAIRHIQDQLLPNLGWSDTTTRPTIQPRQLLRVDTPFALACIDTVKKLGIPAHYRAGSQGAMMTNGHGSLSRIELVLMRLQVLPFENPNQGTQA